MSLLCHHQNIRFNILNLSGTDIEELPDSITDLQNLQTLNLHWCNKLRTLPENIRKLTNLRSLDVSFCRITHMPSGLAGLTSLNRLPKFIVNKHYAELRKKSNSSAKLSDLKELNNLRGDLHIMIDREFEKNMEEEAMEANLTNKQGLTELNIVFYNNSSFNHDEAVLEGLKPHSNLRKLEIKGYKGKNLPSWARRGNLCITLPNLVVIRLHNCSCQQVPVFSQLRFLKRLVIDSMDSVEYMEDGVCDTSSSSSQSQGVQTLFFPSLEVLELNSMEKLKGWWKGVEAIESTNDSENTLSSELVGAGQEYYHNQLSMQFCKLSLYIRDCPELKFLPHCPKVNEEPTTSGEGDEMMPWKSFKTNLRSLIFGQLPKMVGLPSGLQYLTNLRYLKLRQNEELREIPEWISCLSSLEALYLANCPKLTYLPEALSKLTSLNKLVIYRCPGLTERCLRPNGLDCPKFQHVPHVSVIY